VRKLEGEGPLGKPRHRWKAIKIGVKEIGWKSVEWVHLALDRGKWRDFVKLRVP
jgi:hypothetical protein